MPNTPLPFGTVVFCDDIRFEAGNKTSLVGVYSGDMTFPNGVVFPAALPKLGAAVMWYEAIDIPFDELIFKLGMRRVEADPDLEDEFPIGEVRVDTREAKARYQRGEVPKWGKAQMRLQYYPIFLQSPCIIPFPGIVRVRVIRGDETWGVGALLIHGPADPDQLTVSNA